MKKVLGFALLVMMCLPGTANSAYVQLWTAPEQASGCALIFCDAGNTDSDPQLEVLYACGCPEYFHCLILVDGMTGATEWSYPDPVYIFDGRLAVSGQPPWPWHNGPQLLDVDADGLDEIMLVYRTSESPDYWKIAVFDGEGGVAVPSTPIEEDPSLGQLHRLPNPFGSKAAIEYTIERGSEVNLSVYSVQGQLVRTLVDSHVAPGKYVTSWDGTDNHGRRVASGTYFYRLRSGSGTKTEKTIFLK